MNAFLRLLCLSLASLCACAQQLTPYPTKVAGHPGGWRPGVLVIRVGGLAATGGILGGLEAGAAPSLERLAAAGRSFTAHYATATHRDAALHSTLTGKWPAWSGLYEDGQQIAPEWRTFPLPEALHRAGYRVGGFGRVFAGFADGDPVERAFDKLSGSARDTADTLAPAALEWSGATERVAPTALLLGTDELPAAVAAAGADPVARRAAYAAALKRVDAALGRLIAEWLATAPGRDGIVIVWSDRPIALDSTASPLSDAATRVPLIVVAPNLAAPGTPCASVTSNIQLYATLAELCRLGTPLDLCDPRNPPPVEETLPVLHGRSLAPWLLDPRRASTRPAITVHGWSSAAVRHLHYRYVKMRGGREEFYDLAADPGERNNLAAGADLRTTELMRRIARHYPLQFVPLAPFAPGRSSVFPPLNEEEQRDAARSTLGRM